MVIDVTHLTKKQRHPRILLSGIHKIHGFPIKISEMTVSVTSDGKLDENITRHIE